MIITTSFQKISKGSVAQFNTETLENQLFNCTTLEALETKRQSFFVVEESKMRGYKDLRVYFDLFFNILRVIKSGVSKFEKD